MSDVNMGTAQGHLSVEASGVDKGVDQANAAMAKLGKGMSQSAQQAQQAMVKASGQAMQFNDIVRNNWWGVQNLSRALTLFGGVATGAIVGATAAAVMFEDQMANVAKTTYDTSQSAAENKKRVDELGKSIQDMAAIKPVSHSALTDIAANAGALGIASDDVVKFTGVVADLVAVTDLTADAASAGMARIAAAMNLPVSGMENLASAILEVGRSTAATESQILKMSQRLVGAAATVGLTTDQLIGLSGAIASVGIPVEMGSTAIQKTLLSMYQAVQEGGPILEGFAKASGQSAEEFRAAFEEDSGQAFETLIVKLAEFQNAGGDVIGTLNEMGIVDTRMRATILRLIAAQGQLTDETGKSVNENQKLTFSNKKAYEEFLKGSSLAEITAERYKTLYNQIKILKNQIVTLAQTYGAVFMPALGLAVELLQDFVKGLQALPSPARTLLAVTTALVGGFVLLGGSVISIAGKFSLAKTAFGQLQSALLGVVEGQTGFVAATTRMSGSTTRFSSSMGGFAKSTATMSGAIDALIVAIGNLERVMATLVAANKGVAGSSEIVTAAVVAETRSMQGNTQAKAANRAISGGLIAANEAVAASYTVNAAQASAAAASMGRFSKVAKTTAATTTAAGTTAAAAGGGLAIFGNSVSKTSTGMQKSAKAGAGFLGMLTKLGKVWKPLLAVAVLAGIAITAFGSTVEAAEEEVEQFADANDALVEYIRKGGKAAQQAVTDYISLQLTLDDTVKTAERLGLTIQDLNAILQGTATADVTAKFEAMRAAAVGGDKSSQKVVNRVAEIGKALSDSADKAALTTKVNNTLGASDEDLADSEGDKSDAIRDATDKIEDQNQAILSLVDAQKGVRDSQKSLADAQESYNELLRESTSGINEVLQAELDLAEARMSLDQANKDLADAEKKLSTARQDELDNLADAEDDLADARDKYIDSLQKITDAEANLEKMRSGGSLQEILEATNKLANAQLKLLSATRAVEDAEWQLQYLREEGASARDIRDAEDTLAQTRQDVADAEYDAAEAAQNLDDVRNGASSEEIAKAEREYAAAIRDSRDALNDVKDSEQEVADLRLAVANDTAYKQAQNDLQQAQIDLQRANQGLAQSELDLANARATHAASARELQEASDGVTDAILGIAKANVELKVQQAAARGEMISAGQQAQMLKDELSGMLNLAPDATSRAQIQGYIDTLSTSIPEAAKKGTQGAEKEMEAFNPAVPAVPVVIETDLDKAKKDFMIGAIMLSQGIQQLWEDLQVGWDAILESVKEFWSDLTTGFQFVVDVIRESAQQFWSDLQTGWDAIVNWVTNTLKKFWSDLTLGFQFIWDTIYNAVTGFWENVKIIWEASINWIVNHVRKFWSDLQAGWDALIIWVVDHLQGFWNRVVEIWDSLINWIVNHVRKFWTDIKSGFQEMREKIVEGIQNFWDTLKTRFTEGVHKITTAVTDLGKDIIRGLWNGIIDPGFDFAKKMTEWVKDHVPGPIAKVLGIDSPSKLMMEYGTNTAEGLLLGILAQEKALEDAATSVAQTVADAMNPADYMDYEMLDAAAELQKMVPKNMPVNVTGIMANAALSPATNTTATGGDTYQISTIAQDAQEIADEIMWSQIVRTRS